MEPRQTYENLNAQAFKNLNVKIEVEFLASAVNNLTATVCGLGSVLLLGDGKTTDEGHKLHPVINSIWTERNFHTVTREQNVRSKFIRYSVNLALFSFLHIFDNECGETQHELRLVN